MTDQNAMKALVLILLLFQIGYAFAESYNEKYKDDPLLQKKNEARDNLEAYIRSKLGPDSSAFIACMDDQRPHLKYLEQQLILKLKITA